MTVISKTGTSIFRFDDFEADTRARELYRRGIKIKVYGQPFEILLALLERPGEVVTRDQLRQRLWPTNTFVDFERVLNTSVMRLRNALGDSATTPRYVETLPRVGYRFISPVEVVEGEAPRRAPSVAAIEAPPTPAATPEATTGATTGESEAPEEPGHPEAVPAFSLEARRMVGAVLVGATVMAMVVAVGLSWGGWRRWQHAQTQLDKATGRVSFKARPAIAILGFKNLSGRPEEAWLSTAFSEMFTTEMGAGETLRVIPTREIAVMKASRALPDSDKYAQELLQAVRSASGAEAVVLGSYTALGKDSGGQVRLDVHVQDTSSGEIRAHLSATGTEAKLFPMVAQMGAELRKELGVSAIADEEVASLSASLPDNAEAARLYSEGLTKLRGFHPREARDLLAHAAQIEPKFAIGHSALSAAWMVLGYDDRAREEAKKAVERSAGLSREERLLVEERYREQTKEWAKAAELAGALHTFFPDRVDYGVWAARMQTLAGKPADALVTLQSLGQLPPPAPMDPLISMTEAEALQELGKLAAALQAIREAEAKCRAVRATALEPNIVLEEGNILADMGDSRAASTALERAEQLFGAMGDPNGAARALNKRADVSAQLGKLEDARRMYERVVATYRSAGNASAAVGVLEEMARLLESKGDTPGARAAHAELVSLQQRSGTQMAQAASRQRVLP